MTVNHLLHICKQSSLKYINKVWRHTSQYSTGLFHRVDVAIVNHIGAIGFFGLFCDIFSGIFCALQKIPLIFAVIFALRKKYRKYLR